MELCIHFSHLPEGMELLDLQRKLDELLDDSGQIIGVRQAPGVCCVELELEDERANPKHGILAVKHYLQEATFDPDTTIELAGTPVGIYE